MREGWKKKRFKNPYQTGFYQDGFSIYSSQDDEYGKCVLSSPPSENYPTRNPEFFDKVEEAFRRVEEIKKEFGESIASQNRSSADIGTRMRQYRIDHSERIIDMADKLKISCAQVSQIEAGRIDAPQGFERRLKQAYPPNSSDE